MGTDHYNFTYIDGAKSIDISGDTKIFLDEIDSAICKANIGSYKGTNIVFIGDSYAFGTGCSDHYSGDTKRFSSIICAALEANEFNYAVGSTGFCDPGSDNQNSPFPAQVNQALTGRPAMTGAFSMPAMTEYERENTSIVIIAGGINDFSNGTYSGSDIRDAAELCCTRARANFPNAKIILFPMLFKGWGFDSRAFNYASNAISGAVYSKCATGIEGCWSWNFGYANRFSSDKLHPNDTGHSVIAGRMLMTILNGGTSNWEDALELFTWKNGWSSSVSNNGYGRFQSGTMYTGNMNITGGLSAGSNLIGSVEKSMIPIVNVYTGVYKENVQVGTFCITDTGNVYVIADKQVNDSFFVAPIAYMPYGGEF